MRIQHPNEKWSSAYTANVSIGQGYDLTTPLQMAMAYSTIANGGISYYPRLVDRVLNQDGSPVLDADGRIAVPTTPKVHADFRNELTPELIEIVRHGFWKVVNEDGGTGSIARMENVQVAGKTGTAQAMLNGKRTPSPGFAVSRLTITRVTLLWSWSRAESTAVPSRLRSPRVSSSGRWRWTKANLNRNSPGSRRPANRILCDDQGDQIPGRSAWRWDGDEENPAWQRAGNRERTWPNPGMLQM
jgi:hypothetical protein